ncbi:MAG: hypothetical protein H5T86_16980, partial [Armatimonadetes bacterium]|nr:hypothetical protein [Armatimonadota bacterium]
NAKQLLERALELDEEAQQLLRQGDLAGYQQRQQQQRQILEQLKEVMGR